MGLIAIGDIHGCAKSLDAMLAALQPSGEDHLVFIGDYIDRGPDSKGVIERLLALKERISCTFLKGNHEELMLGYLDQGEFGIWEVNGGRATLESYEERDGRFDMVPEHIKFIRELKLYYETKDFFFVHAGLSPQLTVAENVAHRDPFVYLWERSHLRADHLPWEKTVVCGHTPVSEPINRENLINIDTGCVYHERLDLGRLTAVRLPEREFISVPYQE